MPPPPLPVLLLNKCKSLHSNYIVIYSQLTLNGHLTKILYKKNVKIGSLCAALYLSINNDDKR